MYASVNYWTIGDKFQWNSDGYSNIFICNIVVFNMATICFGFNVLTCKTCGYLIHLPLDKLAAILEDIFKCNLLDENVWISIEISLNFVPEGPINNIPALVQIMARRRPGDKPLSEAMLTQFTDAYMRHLGEMT